jgi:hypothetical protein
MSFKKTIVAVAAVTALTAATAVPAMALENEFHGLYRLFAFQSNAETGGGTFNLQNKARDAFFVEQRARIMYIAKANDNLKLVTHFELDSRFGGQDTSKTSTGANATTQNQGKYPNGDGGSLDADRVILEMKNVYLDFNIPATPVNMKVGIQPFNDAYQGVFGNFDGAGAVASAKFGAFTPTLGWFRIGDNNFVAKTGTTSEILPGKQSQDLIVVDGKFALNKDVVLGVSYYNVQNDKGTAAAVSDPTTDYELLHMLGVNASANVGPAALSAFAAAQFGDYRGNRDLSAFAGSVMAKVAVGPGKINASALYLSGQKNRAATTGDFHAFRQIDTSGAESYYNPSNMWLLIRNGATINSSTAINGVSLTKGDAGIIGFFGGYEATMGKVIASANAGYAMADQKGSANSGSMGTEINATVGYKVYDNLTASLTGAYLFLGKGYDRATGTLLPGGVANADNPYMTNIQLNYLF